MLRWPVELFCQRMSTLPSLLKSPAPAISHSVGMVGSNTYVPSQVVPFINHILRWPVELFCQRMSTLPSPLKSPVPAILHSVGIVGRSTYAPSQFVPFISQILRCPVELFCQRRSPFASPLKSGLITDGVTRNSTEPAPHPVFQPTSTPLLLWA